MTALVADKVAFWLADHPGSTVEEIARGIHHRDIAVREVLQSPLFVFGDRGGRKVYSLRTAGRDATGRAAGPRRETDSEFLLRILGDGQPHCLNEILRRSMLERGCGLTTHSRAADLRARGFDVRNWKDGQRGEGSWYRLVPSETPMGAPEDGAAATSGGTAAPESATLGVSLDTTASLTEPGLLLPAVGARRPPLAGHGTSEEVSVTGDPRPGSVSDVSPDTTGQLTLVGEPFRKQQRAA